MKLTNQRASTVISRAALLACVGAAMGSLTLGVAMPAAGQTTPHEAGAHVHATAAKLVNPVKPTPASVAVGKAAYERQCASCHGPAGKGDGKAGLKMTPKPSDLTDASWKHGPSDGEIYTLIKDGSKNTPMKGFASKMTAQDMWSVVNYLRILRGNYPPL